ncbi:MAG TPA: nucleotidyltransferase [Polyangiaceae bacterium]|nr:nucleotidyltransferase [Polyangiaceae bacterium]
MAELGLNQDYKDLLICLADEGADFLLIGGWALALHGHGRGTDDMDVFVRAEPENAERVFRALVAFGAPVAAHGVTASLFATPGYGYRVGMRPNLIELLTTIDGVTFDEAWAEKRSFELDGRRIHYIGRRALLVNKRAAGRAKDLADAEWLEAHPDDE